MRVNGSYADPDSGPYTAGLTQPATPTAVFNPVPGPGFNGYINGPVSFKIARERTTTGARSIASTTSAVATGTAGTVYLTFPVAISGQNFWRIFGTQQGFGGVGVHYTVPLPGTDGLLDLAESLLTRNVTGIGTNIGNIQVTAAVGTFLSTDVGKNIVLAAGSPGAGTTIVAVAVDGSTADMSGAASATGTTTAALHAYANGANIRTIEIEYRDGDLLPIETFIDDYPPPDGTHAVVLESYMAVLGAYPDAMEQATVGNAGPVISVSLPGYFESHKPDAASQLYLPEPPVDVLARPTDSYAYIACENSLHALQVTGTRTGAGLALTTISPDTGIAYRHNWCQAFGRLFVYLGKGKFVGMTADGQMDDTWGDPVRGITKDWTEEDTKLGFDAQTNCVMAFNGSESVVFPLSANEWSNPCYLPDGGAVGNVTACTPSNRRLIVSVDNSGTNNAYIWDEGATEMPITAISRWRKPPGRQAMLNELSLGLETNVTDKPIIVGVHKNLRTVFSRLVNTVNASNTFTVPAVFADDELIGAMVCVFGADVGGTGVDYLIGNIFSVPSGTTITLVDDNNAPVNAQATLTGCYTLFADEINTYDLARTGEQELANLRDWLVRDM